MSDPTAIIGAGTGWTEVFLGGSREAEDELIRRRFAPEINRIQRDIARIDDTASINRAQHNKMVAGTKNAEFQVLTDIPEDLRVGLFQPGKKYAAHVRFSNASGFEQPDSARDLRGAAVRVIVENGKVHDFLITNAPFSHARDARQFMIIASAIARQGRPGVLWKLGAWRTVAGLVRIVRRLGWKEAMRVLRTIREQTSRPVASLATEQYWSRSPFAFGAVAAQRYVDPVRTPIEDGTVEWKEADAPFTTVGYLTIPSQELDAVGEADINNYAFNPWNTSSDDYRPLGSMNRARKLVYFASAKMRNEN